MNANTLGVIAFAAVYSLGACGGDDIATDRDVSPVDAVAIDVPVDSTYARTCNLDPIGRLVAEMDRVANTLEAYYQANGRFPNS